MSKKKMARRALFTSVISLVLCCAMLMGTTFAWFTDSVSSAKNQIQSGNLDIELEYSKDMSEGSWKTVEGATDLVDPEAKWEPGHTEVVYLRISNKGSLALKYNFNVTVADAVAGITEDGKPINLSEHLKYDVVDVDDAYADRDAARNAVAANAKALATYSSNGSMKAGDEPKTVALVVFMPEEVGNEANHKTGTTPPSIELGFVLNATQLVNESDSFGSDYDDLADLGPAWDGTSKKEPEADENGVIHITNAAELVAMMDVTGNSIYIGKTIVLDANINLGGRTVKGIGCGSNFAGVFDGQGYTIGNFKIDASDRDYYAGLFNQVSHGGTVKNLTVSNATVKGNSMVGAVASSVDSNATVDNCKAINCTLIGVKKVGAVVGYSAGSTVTNNYAENCTVYYSEKEGAEVLGFENTGSTVSNNNHNNVKVVAKVTNSDGLKTAIENKAAEIVMARGNYSVSFTNNTDFNVDGMTITGQDGVNLSVSSSEAWYGRIQGSNVTFKDITFTGNVGATGEATYNNCTFEGQLECASSGGAKTYVNSCNVNTLHTSVDMNAGNVYVKESTINKAEYSGAVTMTFEGCTIGELIPWNTNTVLNKCNVTTLNAEKMTTATLIIDGKYYAANAD